MKNFDVIIIGAGAASLMCAIELQKRNRKVLILEHTQKIGKKILVSGGGKCNFTNLHVTAENFLSQNKHFCKSALAQFSQHDFIALVKKHKIAFHEKKNGQLFCDVSANEILKMLLSECQKAEFLLGCKIEKITKNGFFTLKTNFGNFTCNSLVVATGGLSIPKMGATDFGYKVAAQFGLKIVQTKPALVPFYWNEKDLENFWELAGISLEVLVSCGKKSFLENLLFTHKGLSGPAILQISSYWQKTDFIEINLLPGKNAFEFLKSKRQSKTELKTILAELLPKRFVTKIFELFFTSKPLNQFSEKELKKISEFLNGWKILPNGTEGYKTAEVTFGGIDTTELSSKTMETQKVKGLFFIGEVVDVTGELGGFNFQWAWSSGFCAGKNA
ncbi:NAD(P)/FAD-dependent oxidoreductase [bacterium]|nr:NAD(P)/FAD-dependent oxidoreductase [bacterium]